MDHSTRRTMKARCRLCVDLRWEPCHYRPPKARRAAAVSHILRRGAPVIAWRAIGYPNEPMEARG